MRIVSLFVLSMVMQFAVSKNVLAQVSETDAKVLATIKQKMKSQPTSVLFYSQDERDVAFKYIDRLYPTRLIETGDKVLEFGSKPTDLSHLTYQVDDKTYSFADFLNNRALRGIMVWQDGDVLFEHYGEGNNASTRWVSFSVAKSVTSMLIGAAIKDGYIKSVNEPVVNYVSRFRGTDYDKSTIKDVLQMSSGVAWNEDYADPNSDVSKAGAANGITLVKYLAGLKRESVSGEKFNYNSGETNLVGEILRAAIGNNASTYLTHKIWQPFGMQDTASWMLGSPGGGELGGCCINATLRDYVRIGIFALQNGVLADGTKVLPDNWMQDSVAPSKGFAGYGYLWWLDEGGTYRGRGIFAQQIFIDPVSKLVVAVHGNAKAAVGSEFHQHLEPAMAAIHGSLK